MIDLPDGLATESRVRPRIDVEALPVSEATRAAARALGAAPLSRARSSGEDYELLFTAASERAADLARDATARTGTPVHRIGEIRPAGEGLRFLDRTGRPRPVAPGVDHFG